MFLNLPTKIFVQKEISRLSLQQNDADWVWYFWLSTDDPNTHVGWTGNNMGNTNYIIFDFKDRSNRTINVDVQISDDSSKTNILYDYKHQIKLLFEENLNHVNTYYPSPVHFRLDDSTNCKVILHPLSSTNPSWDVDRAEWRGFQCVGTRIWNQAAIIELPIDNFAPSDAEWNYAIVYGHWLDHQTNLLHKTNEYGIKPISWVSTNREFVIVLEPGESLMYSSYFDGYGRGFGITFIQFFSETTTV